MLLRVRNTYDTFLRYCTWYRLYLVLVRTCCREQHNVLYVPHVLYALTWSGLVPAHPTPHTCHTWYNTTLHLADVWKIGSRSLRGGHVQLHK